MSFAKGCEAPRHGERAATTMSVHDSQPGLPLLLLRLLLLLSRDLRFGGHDLRFGGHDLRIDGPELAEEPTSQQLLLPGFAPPVTQPRRLRSRPAAARPPTQPIADPLLATFLRRLAAQGRAH